MSYFKLNISKLSNNISNYKANRKKIISDLELIYGNIKNTDSGWNDENSVKFVKNAKLDNYKIDEYIDILDLLYSQIENVNNSFINLIHGYGYGKDSTIIYDDSYYQICIKKLKNVVSYFDRAIAYLDNCNFSGDFTEIYRATELKIQLILL